MTVLVLGADGMIGWPLLCLLATRTREPIVAVDDLSKRRRVAEEGYASVLRLAGFEERLEQLRRVTGRGDLSGVVSPVVDCIEELVHEHRPATVFHLAQIPSAPFSMKSARTARETVRNNIEGNLALLFALKTHSPRAHLVKMGSMGKYAPCGVPIAEGYVDAVLDGHATAAPVPFPRAADDVYHVSKISDSAYVAMATRVWGLAATDVMQSVVYGVHTELSRQHPELHTRFDCDPTFGTVVNRLVAQAVLARPLSVYGDGSQTTGLIHLQDSVRALCRWAEDPARSGEHRVINQTTETRISIRELAEVIRGVAAARGVSVEISHEFDPRHECGGSGRAGEIRNRTLREAGLPLTTLEAGIAQLWDDLVPYRENLSEVLEPPYVDWIEGDRIHPDVERISLNPGMLGEVLPTVAAATATFRSRVADDPLGAYLEGRAACAELRREAAAVFGGEPEGWGFAHGHTSTIDRIAWSVARFLGGARESPIPLVTSEHEHPGGIRAFLGHPGFSVRLLPRAELLRARARVFFLSHRTYDLNLDLSAEIHALSRREDAPLVIVDGCQALAQVPVDVQALGCHAYLASAHKWLGGPPGSGLLYLRQDALAAWPTPFLAGEPLDVDSPIGRWEPRGGLDFAAVAGLVAAIQAQAGPTGRTRELRDLFVQQVHGMSPRLGVRESPEGTDPAGVAILELPPDEVYGIYQQLRARGVSVKCIKNARCSVLRLGFPWWLSRRQVERAASLLQQLLGD